MMRIFLAGLLGGIAMFIWTSIAHMALPLGDTGVREMPNETIVLDSMQANIGEKSGFYYFPGLGLGDNPTHEQKSEAMKHMNESSRPSSLGDSHLPPGGFAPVPDGVASVSRICDGIDLGLPRRLPFGANARDKLWSPGGLCYGDWDHRGDCDQRFLLELVWLPHELHCGLHVDSVHRLSLRGPGCWFRFEESDAGRSALIVAMWEGPLRPDLLACRNPIGAQRPLPHSSASLRRFVLLRF